MFIEVIIHSDVSSYVCEKVDVDSLNEIKTKIYWINHFKKKFPKNLELFSNTLDNVYRDCNLILIDRYSGDLNRNAKYFKDYHCGSDEFVFIPELIDINLNELNSEQLYTLSLKKFNIYIDEFTYRIKLNHSISKLFGFNKNVFTKEIQELYNANSNIIRHLSKENINTINNLLEINNCCIKPKSILLNENYNIDNLDKILKKLDFNESIDAFLNNNKKIKINAKRGLFNYSIKSFFIEYDDDNFLYYEPFISNYDTITLCINKKLYSYYIYNYGEFINLIDNYYELIMDLNKLLPKFEILSIEHKNNLLNYLK